MWGQQASTFAEHVDWTFYFIFAIAGLCLLGITIFMIYCVIKFNRKKNPQILHTHGSTVLEVIWTVIPTILVCFMFYYGWVGYADMRTVPENHMTIPTHGGKWYWKFVYEHDTELAGDVKIPEGIPPLVTGSAEGMVVPVDTPIKVPLISDDVVHAFYVPAFRVKYDVMPSVKGEENWLWFQATEVGEFDMFCAEYCGIDHARMITKVKVLSKEDYKAWYQKSLQAWIQGVLDRPGFMIWSTQCASCHSNDGTKKIGPSWKGIYNANRPVIVGGKETQVKADDDYLKRAILQPSAEVVKGYQDQMPPQKLTDEQIQHVIDYIKTLK